MTKLLSVEGLTDATFFQELLQRLVFERASLLFDTRHGRQNMPQGIEGVVRGGVEESVEFRYGRPNGRDVTGGISGTHQNIEGLLEAGIREFVVAQDIDDGGPEQVFQSIQGVVDRCLGVGAGTGRAVDRRIVLAGGIITVLPMGLSDDAYLAEIGVARHALEDYLIRAILEDAGLRQNAPELRLLLSRILPIIRDHEGVFDSSKQVYQLIKPIVQHRVSDTGAVRHIIRSADEGVLRSVLSPLLQDVERAFGV